jgi:ECF transporter S component (folate family)
MLAALAVLLDRVTTINIGPYIKIGFSGLPNQVCDALFGPVTGMLFAAIMDVVKYFLRPDGPFFFGFTFNAMLAAFIFGCFFYKKKITIWRVLAAKAVVALVVNIILNTWFLDMLYGKGFLAVLPMRALKNVIMWPIESIIFFLLYTAIRRTGIFRIFETGRLAKAAQTAGFAGEEKRPGSIGQ